MMAKSSRIYPTRFMIEKTEEEVKAQADKNEAAKSTLDAIRGSRR